MKKIIFILLSLIFSIAIGRAQGVASDWSGGSGSEDDPFQISDISQLRKLANDCNKGISYKGQYFILTKDIRDNDNVLDDKGDLISDFESLRIWSPIASLKGSPFQGHLDGQGHKLSGIFTGTQWDEQLGLIPEVNSCMFYYIDSASIKNLIIEDSFFYTLVECPVKSTISDCVNFGTSTYPMAVGFAYSVDVLILNCGNYGKSYGAGIASGHFSYFSLVNCYNYGTIYPSNYMCGGLCASSHRIYNCMNMGTIINTQYTLQNGEISYYDIGGICRWILGNDGKEDKSLNLSNCVNYGSMAPFGVDENTGVSYYIGYDRGNTRTYVKNIYWIETSAPQAYKSVSRATLQGDELKMTESEMKSTNFLYKLNNNAKSLDSKCCGWKIGKEGFPILEIIDEEKSEKVEVLDEDFVSSRFPVKYYTLQGVQVSNPQKGLCIRVQGHKKEKCIIN